MDKYRHKKTGKIVTKYGDKITYSTGYVIPNWVIEDSNEWEFLDERWELKIKQNKEIYFVNTITDDEFHVGDKITIATNMSFGDGVRDHVIKGFNIHGWGCVSNTLFKKVLASFVGYDENDRTLPLSDIKKI